VNVFFALLMVKTIKPITSKNTDPGAESAGGRVPEAERVAWDNCT